MANHHLDYVVFVLLALFACSSHAYQFIVGGKDGWVVNPYENYNHWAERMRFQVNDTLLFKYKQGSDSVLVVNKDDYDNCNTANPIQRLDDGNSVYKFDRSGPVFFISGNKSSCAGGQKLVIVVLAVRSRPSLPAPAPATPPLAEAPAPEIAANSTPPADANGTAHPPRHSFATAACAPSVLLALAVSVVLSVVCFDGGFIAFL